MGLLKFSSVPIVSPNRYQHAGLTLGSAIFKILRGIQEEWDFTDSEMAEILQRSPSTYHTWKQSESVSISAERPSANDQTIFAFIDVFDAVSALFYRLEERKQWLRTKNLAFNSESPLDVMKASSENVFRLRDYLNRLINP